MGCWREEGLRNDNLRGEGNQDFQNVDNDMCIQPLISSLCIAKG